MAQGYNTDNQKNFRQELPRTAQKKIEASSQRSTRAGERLLELSSAPPPAPPQAPPTPPLREGVEDVECRAHTNCTYAAVLHTTAALVAAAIVTISPRSLLRRTFPVRLHLQSSGTRLFVLGTHIQINIRRGLVCRTHSEQYCAA